MSIRKIECTLGLANSNGDMFTEGSCAMQYSYHPIHMGDTLIAVTSLIDRTGVLPIAVSAIKDLFESLAGEKVTSNIDTWQGFLGHYDYGDGCPLVTAFLGVEMPNGCKLQEVNDRIMIGAKWQKPSDSDDYYVYDTGLKTLGITYFYTVYNGSTPLLNEMSMSHSRTYY